MFLSRVSLFVLTIVTCRSPLEIPQVLSDEARYLQSQPILGTSKQQTKSGLSIDYLIDGSPGVNGRGFPYAEAFGLTQLAQALRIPVPTLEPWNPTGSGARGDFPFN